ncbi:hypothetical protein ABTZ59_32350 [Streptomyces sp. NPDC094034]|uniref:hypothetical protein n=1 Tax=Streptomyces sp. NPDC094034 TaxID=3155309 RepID=UPI0033189161
MSRPRAGSAQVVANGSPKLFASWAICVRSWQSRVVRDEFSTTAPRSRSELARARACGVRAFRR